MDTPANEKHPASNAMSAKSPVPRGIEVLLKKASVDPEFRQLLLEQRGDAAQAIELDLDPVERAMLRPIPREHLEQLISRTVVPDEQRRVFLGRAAAAMLVAVGAALMLPMCMPVKTRGIQPDRPGSDEPLPDPPSTNAPPASANRGISPDRP